MSQADDDNHADQLNENNDAYWQSRGYDNAQMTGKRVTKTSCIR